jgi:hypothetical protein
MGLKRKKFSCQRPALPHELLLVLRYIAYFIPSSGHNFSRCPCASAGLTPLCRPMTHVGPSDRSPPPPHTQPPVLPNRVATPRVEQQLVLAYAATPPSHPHVRLTGERRELGRGSRNRGTSVFLPNNLISFLFHLYHSN